MGVHVPSLPCACGQEELDVASRSPTASIPEWESERNVHYTTYLVTSPGSEGFARSKHINIQ